MNNKKPRRSIFYYYGMTLIFVMLLNVLVFPGILKKQTVEISYSKFPGHVVDDGQLALGHLHDVLDDDLALLNALVDALAGGAVDVHALDTLVHIVLGQGLDALRADVALVVVAGVECGNNASVLVQIAHDEIPLSNFTADDRLNVGHPDGDGRMPAGAMLKPLLAGSLPCLCFHHSR